MDMDSGLPVGGQWKALHEQVESMPNVCSMNSPLPVR